MNLRFGIRDQNRNQGVWELILDPDSDSIRFRGSQRERIPGTLPMNRRRGRAALRAAWAPGTGRPTGSWVHSAHSWFRRILAMNRRRGRAALCAARAPGTGRPTGSWVHSAHSWFRRILPMNRRWGRAALCAARALGHQRPTGFRGSKRVIGFRGILLPDRPLLPA